jgi:hypothetical protein
VSTPKRYPLSTDTVWAIQKRHRVVLGAHIEGDPHGCPTVIKLRLRWWNWLLLGIPGRNARRDVAQVLNTEPRTNIYEVRA